MTDFASKIVIVTGGSQNIGLAIAEKFLSAGAHVISADLNPPENKNIHYVNTNIAIEDLSLIHISEPTRPY